MLKHYLEKNPLVSQRIRAMKITKGKEESISDVMHCINDDYILAELDKCPVETFMLLHLLTLLPSDPLSEKVKTWLVEAMRVEPNIKSWRKHLFIFSSRKVIALPQRECRMIEKSTWLSLVMG